MQEEQLSSVPQPTPPRKHSLKRVLLIVTAILMCAAVAVGIWVETQDSAMDNALGLKNIQPDWSSLKTNGSTKSYNDAKTHVTARLGVDVSVHQGNIDWKKLKAQGVKFAMVRLGFRGYQTGQLALDKNFKKNVEGAKDAGLAVGVYCFSQAVNEAEAQEEAVYVLQHIQGLKINYPVVFDQEAYAADKTRTDHLTGRQATANCNAFCNAVQKGGYLPMVYTNSDWATQMYDVKTLRNHLIWYADYRKSPALTNGFAMWQYTARGKLAGVGSTYIDMDLLFFPKT